MLNVLIVLLFLLMISVIVFYPTSIFRWVGTAFIISGVLSGILWLMSGNLNTILNAKFVEIQEKGKQFDLLFMQKWVLSYIGGIFKFMLIEGIAIIITGTVLILLSYFIKNKKINATQSQISKDTLKEDSDKRKVIVAISRIIAGILIISAIPFTVIVFSNNIGVQVKKFQSIQKKNSEQKEKISVNDALDSVLGSKLFKTMSEGAKKEKDK